MAVVNTHEAKTNLSRLLDEIQEGEEVVIARGNKPMARLVPYSAKRPVRRPGYLKGKIRVADDFDSPLPDDVLDAFEAGA
ncbi:type II toxin-antitoxin system Phd/YefM family antitoxin [Geotalea uraniireducens]|uniref:Antitoxin n=1 Tax=Geotalea uraniireducens (strain Rf4) TaxID=351605 RepID=A5G4B7_GEOUR|nr:type II toxin-antitoxin system Phd/YefM family antitoxin [Geotalea uraniireducens]ABQ26635.1 prevent-host-death family protein [Geotalea uraniireducens Rf4]